MRRPRPAVPGEINYALLDRFTLIHFGIGVGYGFLGLSFFLVVLMAIAWELVENPLKAYVPFLFPHATSDSLRNSVGDTLAVISGFLVFQAIWK
jgi:hypothetical protein